MRTLVSRPVGPAPGFDEFQKEVGGSLTIPDFLDMNDLYEKSILAWRIVFPEIVEIDGLLFRLDHRTEAALWDGILHWREAGANDQQIETLFNDVVVFDHFQALAKRQVLVPEFVDGLQRGLESSLARLGSDRPCQASLVESDDGPRLTFWQVRSPAAS